MSIDDDPALPFVERALQELERTGRVDLAVVCRDRPDLLAVVEAAFACRTGALRLGEPAGADREHGDPDPRLGLRLGGRYELRARLGAGAMGAVYEAHDTVLGRTVAAKVLHRTLFGGEDEARQRFQREARVAATLRHPGIVVVHDHGTGEPPYLIMDLVAGVDLGTLAAFVAREAQDPRGSGRAVHERFFADAVKAPWHRPWPVVMAAVLASAARAVASAHAQGVVHRDLKPSNLIVCGDASTVVVDFGLARLAGDATLTTANLPIGSPSYMAPEQAAGRPPTIASDVYALGASLYHALALRPPFVGDPATVLHQVQRDDPIPVARVAHGVPRDLAVVCHKAMARLPGDRYASADAFADDLDAFVAGRQVLARPLPWPARTVRWMRRHPERAAVAALAVALLPTLAITANAIAHGRARDAAAAAATARRHVPALATIEGRDAAENLYRSTRPDPATRAALDAVLAADPADEEALAMRAMLHADEGRRNDALADLRTLAREHSDATIVAAVLASGASAEPPPTWPVVPDLPPPRTALDHFLLAYQAVRAARPDVAAAELDAALALAPQHGPSWHLRVLVLMAQRRYDDVLDCASGVEQRLGGATARTLHARGLARARKNQWQAAADDFAASVALAEPSAGTLRNLAIARRHLGDLEGALQLLERAAAQRPEAAGVYLERFNLLVALGRQAEAVALAENLPGDSRVAHSTRAHARGLVLLDAAEAARAQGRDVEPMRSDAESALREALAQATADRRPLLQFALANAAFLEHGEHQRALDEILKALGPAADSPLGLRKASYHAAQAGAPASVARHCLERANLLEPTHRDSARELAIAVLGDEAPDPVRALRLLAAAHRTPEAWTLVADLGARAAAACAEPPERLAAAVAVLADAAATGLFTATPVPPRLLAALTDLSRSQRSLPPELAALVSR